MLRHIRRSKLFLKKAWVNDPINPLELLPLLPLTEQVSLIKELVGTAASTKNAKSFEDFILARYGRTIHEAFFKPSTEKLFRIPADDISVLWAERKARLVNPFKKMDGKSRKYFAYFYYPLEGGYGSICDAYYKVIAPDVYLNAEVTGIVEHGNQVTAIEYQHEGQAKVYECDQLISTLPLTITGKLLGIDIPLSFQKVDAVYLLINRQEAGPYHWVYFIDSDISINRMVEFKHMSRFNAPKDTTVLCAEVTSEEADPIGKVVSDLVRSGYINDEDVLDSMVVREDFSYPVYKVGYENIVEEAFAKIHETKGIHILGRSAEFIHREVDDIVGASKDLVKTILADEMGSEVEMKTEDSTAETVAIVVLSYNNAADTLECLGSLERLEGGPYHTYLVDNGSKDDTVEQVGAQFPDIEILRLESNFGVPIGFNTGIVKALRDGFGYVFILNNDTVSDPKMMIELLNVAQSDHDCAVVMPKVCYYPPKNGTLTRKDVWADGGYFRKFPPAILLKDNRKSVDFEKVRQIEYAPTCGLLIHRRAFENVGLFDEGFFFFYEDWDYSERLRKVGLNLWVAPQALLWHKVSKSTKKDMSFYWEQMGKSTARFLKRHYNKGGQFIQQSYLILRDFFLKPKDFKYLKYYLKGVKAGWSTPLEAFPDLSMVLHGHIQSE